MHVHEPVPWQQGSEPVLLPGPGLRHEHVPALLGCGHAPPPAAPPVPQALLHHTSLSHIAKKKREKNTTFSDVNVMRGQASYWAAQGSHIAQKYRHQEAATRSVHWTNFIAHVKQNSELFDAMTPNIPCTKCLQVVCKLCLQVKHVVFHV